MQLLYHRVDALFTFILKLSLQVILSFNSLFVILNLFHYFCQFILIAPTSFRKAPYAKIDNQYQSHSLI